MTDPQHGSAPDAGTADPGSRDFPEPSEPPEGTWAVLPHDPKLLGHSATTTPSAHHQRQQALTITTLVLGVDRPGARVHRGRARRRRHRRGSSASCSGFYCQLTSENTNQRWMDIIGTGGAAVGLGLSLAHGGFGF